MEKFKSATTCIVHAVVVSGRSRCGRPMLPSRRIGYSPRKQTRWRSSCSATSKKTSSPTTSIATPTTIAADAALSESGVPFSQRLGRLTRVFNAYRDSQSRSPLKTQFWSSVVIYLLADISAQTFSTDRHATGWDFYRTARNLVIGGIASVPGYKWFMFLSRSFNYSSSFLSILTKVTVNQIVFTPIFNTYYFGMSCFLSGGSPQQIVQRVRDTVPTSMMNSLFIWPWFQFFNFTFVEAEMRALSSGVFAIGWQAYLSWLNRRAELRREVV